MSNGRRHEFSYTHHLALSIALKNRDLDLLFDPSEDELFEKALEHASKNGNGEIGKPDIMFRQGSVMVMIEVKHGTEKQVQWDWSTHPCNTALSIKSDTAAVKACAENGAMHYLLQVLGHKELLAQNRVRTVLSIGASFDDDGSYTATPFYGDVETGAHIRSAPFDGDRFFGKTVFRDNVRAARAKIGGLEDTAAMHASLKGIFDGHPDWLNENARAFILTLMWAMAMPKFSWQSLDKDHPFDDVLGYCIDMCRNLRAARYHDAVGFLKTFMSDGEIRNLVPPLDYAEIAKAIMEQADVPCTKFYAVSVKLFGLAPALDRAKLMAALLAGSEPVRVVDKGSPCGLPGIESAARTGTERSCALVGKGSRRQLEMLAMLNLYGIKEQNVYPSIGDVGCKLPKTVVADFTEMPAYQQLPEVSRTMRSVGKGMLGVFAVDQRAISSTIIKDVEKRKELNSKYTLKKLIVYKGFAVMAVENTENPNGNKQTKYICGQSQASTLVKNAERGGLKFSSGKLNNGVWMR